MFNLVASRYVEMGLKYTSANLYAVLQVCYFTILSEDSSRWNSETFLAHLHSFFKKMLQEFDGC